MKKVFFAVFACLVGAALLNSVVSKRKKDTHEKKQVFKPISTSNIETANITEAYAESKNEVYEELDKFKNAKIVAVNTMENRHNQAAEIIKGAVKTICNNGNSGENLEQFAKISEDLDKLMED